VSASAKLDLFLLRNRILIAEASLKRAMRRCAAERVSRESWDEYRAADEHLTMLRHQMAEAIRPHLGEVQS
jgi:hypothetical protein